MRDIDVRRALIAEMHRLHPDKNDTLIVEELGICQGLARVDVAVVNGTVHGYEIKSERDTLNRLKSQVEIYSTALEFITIVAAPVHLKHIDKFVPSWWGIWTAQQVGNSMQLTELREGSRNPNLAPDALVQFLWRDEALSILTRNGLAAGMISKNRRDLWNRLSSHFTIDQLGAFVRETLKQRSLNWRVPSPQE